MTFWQRINRILLWLAVFVLPWQLRHILVWATHQGQFFEYASISIYLSDIFIILVLLTWGLLPRTPKFKLGPASIFWPLTLLILWIWVSVWQSQTSSGNWLVGVANATHFSLFYLFYLYLVNQVEDLIEIIIPLIWGGGFQSLIAIGQYSINHSLGLKYLGESVLNPEELGIPVVIINGVRHLRAHGTLPHANILGGYLAFVLVWAILMFNKIKTGWPEWSYRAILGLGLTAILFSFSRNAWLALAIVLVLGLITRFYSYRHLKGWDWAVVGLILLVAVSQYPAFLSRLDTTNIPIERESIVSREEQIQQFATIYHKYPIMGVGIGQYTLFLEKQDISEIGWHYDPSLPGWMYNLSHQVWDYQPVHNIFLLVLAELGWVGEILLLALLLGLLWAVGRQLIMHRSLVAFTALAALLIVALLGLWDHYLWTLQPGRLILFLSIGIAAIVSQYNLKNLQNYG